MCDEKPAALLADQIFARLQQADDATVAKNNSLDDKMVDVYTKVGVMLSRYRSGKIPKAFKILPRLENWEKVLLLTQPDTWTPNAVYQATKIFVSSLSPKLAERFLTGILLPRVRQDIAQNKKLNSHLYEALKKSMYKPAAFFKGIVLAICEEDQNVVTLKEATVIASVVAKLSIPVLHSAAALLRLSRLPYSGPRSIFIKTLLDKKYALPLRVIDSMVEYFMAFKEGEEKMPVLWHQGLLIFVQRYKKELHGEHRENLHSLLEQQQHDMITAEIVRELQQSHAESQETSMMLV